MNDQNIHFDPNHAAVMAYQARIGGSIAISLKKYQKLMELPEARRILEA